MDQTFDFEFAKPPALNENLLRRELERRQERRKVLLLILAALLGVAAAVAIGLVELQNAPLIGFVCIGYALLTLIGGGITALVYARKGGSTT